MLLRPGDARIAVETLLSTERKLLLLGSDCHEEEAEEAARSRRPGAGMLRLLVDLSSEKLDARLATIRKQSEELIEKRGVPCGYVTSHFLHWVSVDGQRCEAPMVLIPVDIHDDLDESHLERRVVLAPGNRDTTMNPVLFAYLRRHFNIDVPKLEEGSELTADEIERWVDQLGPICTARAGWRIERTAAFGLFDCGAISVDCDPSSWNGTIGESAALTTVLLGTAQDETPSSSREFLPQTLVLEADGSQLHTLDLAAQGKSLVIHGPPGSGKSQTIVNLIAQAMAGGKSVLFVAQKPQAAMVVLHRLRSLGLDPFCTSLMPVGSGSKSNLKRSVLEGLTLRLKVRDRPTTEDLQRRERLNQAVRTLEVHAAALHHVLPQFGRAARDIVADLALLQEGRVDRFLRTEVVEPATPARFAEATITLQHLVALRADIPEDAMVTVGGIGSIRDPGNPNAQAAQFRELVERLAEQVDLAARAADQLKEIGVGAPAESLKALVDWVESRPDLGVADDSNAVEFAARLHRHGAREAFQRLSDAKRAMRRILDEAPDARRRIPTLVSTDPKVWASASKAIEVGGLAHVPVKVAGHLGHALGTAERQLRATLLSGASSTSARVLSEAPSYASWRGRLTLLGQLEHGLAHGKFLCGVITRGCPSAARLNELLVSIRGTEAVRSAAGRRLSLAAMPALEDLERLHAVLGPRTGALGWLWAFATSKDYRHCRSVFKAMERIPVRRREWDSEIRGAIELRTAERTLASQITSWGYSGDAGKVQALEAACAWLAGIERTAQAASIPIEAIWEIMRERHEPALEGTEREIGALCATLARDGQLLQAMSLVAGAGAFRLHRFLKMLADAGSAASLAARQSSAWGVERDTHLGALLGLGVAAARALEVEAACASDSDARELLGTEYAGVDSLIGPLELVFAWHGAVMEHSNPDWTRAISRILTERSSAPERLATLKDCASMIARSARGALQLCMDASASFEMRGTAARLAPGPEKSLAALADCLRAVRAHQASILKVFRHHAAAVAARSLVGSGLVERYLDGTVDGARITESFQASVYRHALESDPALVPLVDFDRTRLERCLLELRDTDEQLRSVNAAILRGRLAARKAPAGVDIGRVRDKTQFALIRHVVQTPKARLDLTGLYRRAGAAMRELQPCTIATPTTVSEYLPRKVADFDLVIIDEASQVEPASAIGSIARGAQVIIVGDPKQLPPTNFFGGARMVGGDGTPDDQDDPGDGVADVESILDRAIGSLGNVHLRGHYRSKHHSLIEYSNRHFYDAQLVVPPSTVPRCSRYGVVAHHIKDAFYSAGENEVEAKAVAEAVLRHLRQSPGESLGVVAFNARQADLIERHITALARRSREDFHAYAKACDAETPLFVRNLESVQGDERDVIFISYTYGFDPVAKVVYQRFGPLTQQGGGRRLNVLVTRARNRVEVFHSLEPTDIHAESGGVPLMRAYLQHAMRDAQHDFSEGAFESAFEERVAAIIAQINPSLVVRPQVGCEGFRIDLGVALQSAPHRFILGIECDGASYHSEPSARQRDMIRQAILEQHGWTIHRIWSTAWWHNFAEERARLAAAIEAAIAARG
jgi:very-short-patch-repair endonuclease